MTTPRSSGTEGNDGTDETEVERKRKKQRRVRFILGNHNNRGLSEESPSSPTDDELRGRYRLRARKPREFDHQHTVLAETVLTQYPVKRGLEIFGEKGSEAVMSEVGQLDKMGVIEPQDASSLSRNQKRRALPYLMFLKQKRCGKIKARGCADGRRQRIYKSKEETASPTVAIESVMMTCGIEAAENRAVVTVDVPGAFMQANMDEENLIMKIDGPTATLLGEMNPSKYQPFIVKGKEGTPSMCDW